MATILVVEDEKPLRDFLTFFLEGAGHRVMTALSGREALALVAKDRPDLVLSDMMMPIVSGLELCRRLKESEDTRDIPFILMSAANSAGGKLAGEIGADGYLDKPFDLDCLEALIQEWTSSPPESRGA